MKLMIFPFAIIGATTAFASAPGEFAKRLVAMRSEVEEAGNAYEEALQKRKAALEPLQMRHTELEAQISKEELRTTQLKEKLKAAGGLPNAGSVGKIDQWKALESWVTELSSLVEGAVPFRLKERREKVTALAERIRQRRESAITLGADLWNATEKELQLTKDVEYRIGKLPLPGGESEVEIARLGMAHLLYRSSGGGSGFSAKKNGKWELVASRDPEESSAVDRIVGRLKAKSANGWYEVPGLDSVPREEAE